MKCKSAESFLLDAYNAGVEIGESLSEIEAEAILLFPSVHYEKLGDLFEGIRDTIDKPDLIILGGTGDGYYVDTNVQSVGVGAMGFNGEGAVTWDITIGQEGTCEEPFSAAQEAARQLTRLQGKQPTLTFCLVPMACDGTKFVEGLRSEITTPVIGALVGDDRKFKTGMVLVDGKVYEDQSVLLGLWGDFPFATNLASGWQVIGPKAEVTEIEGSCIKRIGDETAIAFINRQYGEQRIPASIGNLAFYPDPESENHFMRTIYKQDDETGSATCFGSIELGSQVRACYADRDHILAGATEAVTGLNNLNFTPTGALLVSCAGRKWALGNRTHEELNPLSQLANKDIPILGIPAFGEIGPHRDLSLGTYGPSFFHNTTYVLTVFG